MNADRPVLGILLMLGFCLLAPFGDAVAKLLSGTIPLVQLVAARFALQAMFLAPLMLRRGRLAGFTRRVLGLTLLRTLLHILGLGMMFLALRHLPLADAVAIVFVMPFVALLLGWAFLGEAVGPRRTGAAVVGFAGTLLIVQPSFAEVGLPALWPLGVAVVFALFMLVTRMVARGADAPDPVALQFVSGAMASALLLPLLAVFAGSGRAEIDPIVPEAAQAALLLLLGALGTLAHLAMTWSLRFAPTATVAPMQYLEIPVAALVGLAVFGDFPDGIALIGIAVTVAAGLYVIARERAIQRQGRAPLAPAPPAA